VTAARWLASAALVAVMALAVFVAPLCAWYSSRGLWTMTWMAGMLAAILAASLGLHALQPGTPCDCPCNCPAPGRPDYDGAPGWCDPCRMRIHQEA
jgi:hypothetical protein